MAVPTKEIDPPQKTPTLLLPYLSQRKKKGNLLSLLFAIMFFVGITLIGLVVVILISFLSTVLNHSTERLEEGKREASTDLPKVAVPYLPIYEKAGQKYGVPWPILAAIHKIETDFGRNLSESSVGASGHMQFMDKTWLGWKYPGGTHLGDLPDHVDMTRPDQIKKHGGYGLDADGDGKADPKNPVDAIYAAARYLSANHRSGADWFARRGAVWQYNHDYENYVLVVKKYTDSFAVPVNLQADSATGQFLWPVSGARLTSPFGLRAHPIKKIVREHEGIDIGHVMGAPILASDSGMVVESRESSGYGWFILLDHGNGFQTLYAHMDPKDVKVRVGQQVHKGQVIALVGNNGWSTGPHLHFEVHKEGKIINPMNLFQSPSLGSK